MNKLFLSAAISVFLYALTASAFAQQTLQTISLKDGTTIKGQLISVTDGFYFIDSPTMGRVKISADQIININNSGVASAVQPAAGTGIFTADADGKLAADTIKTVQTNMMQDPEIMSLIQELIKDPSVAELMKNPGLMQDALSMDPQKVQNNPEVQKLMQNPTMQKIIAVTAQKMQQPRQ